ncbi:MAG: hypothetical protein IEMM0001_1627 [bacterium]|nr:MAG: hypothetical protein IEMM0001_1627 [bacterium]
MPVFSIDSSRCDIREPLINYAIPLAYSLIHNQGGTLKACLGLVKSDNAECESDSKPRRARPEAHIYGIVPSCKGPGHSLRSTLCSCTLQVSQRHGIHIRGSLAIINHNVRECRGKVFFLLR